MKDLKLVNHIDLYLHYAIEAGNYMISKNISNWNFAPNIFECVVGSDGLACYQIGPFYTENPEYTCTYTVLTKISKIFEDVLKNYISEAGEYPLHFGYCGPLDGPGLVTIFIWIPTLIRPIAELQKIRQDLCKAFDKRIAGSPVFENHQTKSAIKGIIAKDSLNITAEKVPIDDRAIAVMLSINKLRAGKNIIPLLWCADPARNFDDPTSRCPIVPITNYAKFIVQESDGISTYEMEMQMNLHDCIGPQSSHLINQLQGVNIPARVNYNDTYKSNTNNKIINLIGSRGYNIPTPTTYDTLPLVISFGYASRLKCVNIELTPDIFQNCTLTTRDNYNVPELLLLLSPNRFDTSTTQGLAQCSEILEALLSEPERIEEKNGAALAINLLVTTVAKLGISSFNPTLLAQHHSQNYDRRPTRSRRVISHYALADNPEGFYSLVASRIWQKLMTISASDQLVVVAEAMSTYLANDHHIIPGAIRTNTELYYFRKSKYKKIGDVQGYLSGLLSPDNVCGKLYILLQRFVTRINHLMGSTIPNETTSLSESVNQTNASMMGYLQLCASSITKLLGELKKPTCKNNLVKEIISKLYQEQSMFLHVSNERYMNDDPYLTGVKNGILEVVRKGSSREVFWRQGTLDDMVTHHLNASYEPQVKGTPKWDYIELYFEKMFKCPRTRKWYICQLAEIFVRFNNKIAVFLVGSTDAGKSLHMSHLKMFVGKEMGESIAPNVLSDPKAGTDAPQPALARAAGGCILFCEETSGIIRNATFKVITGGSAETAIRTLFDKGRTLTFGAKPWFALNHLPKFECYEESIFTRLAIVEPSAKYLNPSNPNLPATPEEQMKARIFPKDPTCTAKIQAAFNALLLYLMEHFDKWDDNNGNRAELSTFTPQMRQAANNVRAQCPYSLFISQHLLKAGQESIISIKETLALFRTNTSAKNKNITEELFVASMSNVIGSYPTEMGWTGWSFAKTDTSLDIPEEAFDGEFQEPQQRHISEYFPYVSSETVPYTITCQSDDEVTYTETESEYSSSDAESEKYVHSDSESDINDEDN